MEFGLGLWQKQEYRKRLVIGKLEFYSLSKVIFHFGVSTFYVTFRLANTPINE